MKDIKTHIANIKPTAIEDPRWKQSDEVIVTQESVDYVERVFKSMLPHFPAWRQTCQSEEELGRLKSAWTKAIMRHQIKTGKKINVKAGLLACEESDSDWLPSVGKFIKWCDQSNDLAAFADRAYKLFINQERQIDNIGQTVVSKHGFELRKMEALKGKKAFAEYYLGYAEDEPITTLDAFSLTDGVTLSKEQQLDAQKRTQSAQDDCMSSIKKQLGLK